MTPAEPLINILIINWNKADYTLRCLESIQHTKYSNKVVTVLDNGSNDNSLSEIRAAAQRFTFPLRFITSPTNIGFAAGMNQLAENTLDEPWDFLFLLNNDATLLSDTLDELIILQKKRPLAIIGTSTYDEDNKDIFTSRRWPHVLYGLEAPYPLNNELHAWPSDYGEGSGLLISREIIKRRYKEKNYLFQPDLFLYCEDLEFGVWAKNNDIETWISKKSKILHPGSASGGGIGNPLAYYYITRNRFILAREKLPLHHLFLFILWNVLTRPPLLAKHLFQRKFSTLKAVAYGIYDGLIGLKGKSRIF
jgi:GT2 family glycosyltransferase